MAKKKTTKRPLSVGESRPKKDRLANLRPPWAPGQSGNPAGRPPGRSLTDVVKAILNELPPGEKKSYLDLLGKRVVLSAVGGKERTLEMLWERTEGKVKDHFINEHSGIITTVTPTGKTNRDITKLVRDKLRAELRNPKHEND